MASKPNAVTMFMSAVGVLFLLGVSWAVYSAYDASNQQPTGDVQNQEDAVRIETRIDQGAAALDVRVIPIELIEDSRCPSDVQCVQAGTVRVRAIVQSGLGEARAVFELGSYITTEAEKVTLVAVEPQPSAANGEIPLSEYRFIFTVEKMPPLWAEGCYTAKCYRSLAIHMRGYVVNIETETLQNEAFRKVLFTAHSSQLVVMAIQPGEDIGKEVHDLDQFLRIEQGSGKAILNGQEFEVGAEWAVVVPAGTEHNLVNTGTDVLKLYTVYSPPNHKDGTVHQTKADVTEEHFDGEVSF